MKALNAPRLLLTLVLVTLVTACSGGGGGGDGGGYDPPGYEPPGGGTPPPSGGPVAPTTYVRSFGSRGDDVGKSLAALPEGRLAITGQLANGTAYGSWFAVLDPSGFPTVQQRLADSDREIGIRFSSALVIDATGALFAGTIPQAATGDDIVVRFRRANGEVAWQRTLDSGRWSGTATLDDARITEHTPSLHAVHDADGNWLGVWVIAAAVARVPGTDDDGGRISRVLESGTAWFLDTNGTQVSRTRLYNPTAPDSAKLMVMSADVLPTGSLAILARETSAAGQVTQVVRSLGRNGTLGAPNVTVPYLSDTRLFALGDVLVAATANRMWRVDLPGQRIVWDITLASAQLDGYEIWSIARQDNDTIAVAGINAEYETRISRFAVANAASQSSCRLASGEAAISLRGRPNGGLRALLHDDEDNLRTVAILDDCAIPAASVVNVGLGFGLRSLEESRLRRGAPFGTELDARGEGVHTTSAGYASRRDILGAVVFSLRDEDSFVGDLSISRTTSLGAAGFGFVTADGVLQHRRADATLARALRLRPAASLANDGEGALWLTPIGTGAGECADGVIVVDASGAGTCRRVPGFNFADWILHPSDGNGVWARPENGNRLVQFASNDYVAVHATRCPFKEIAVGGGEIRASVNMPDEIIVCRETADGRGWRRTIRPESLGARVQLVREAGAHVVMADDGGVTVAFTLRQVGVIEGLRSNPSTLGDFDLALLKFNEHGFPQWLRVYGGAGDEKVLDLVRMSDGGYAILGSSNSLDALTPGSVDMMVVRTGPDGFVGRLADGSDNCQACLGTLSGPRLLEIMEPREVWAGVGVVATPTATSTALAAPGETATTANAAGETNANQCNGRVTDVQEAAQEEPPLATDPPVAAFSVRAQYGPSGANPVSSQDPAYFDANASTPASGITRYDWDFESDGNWDASGVTQQHFYTTRGNHLATLRVSTGAGLTSTVEHVVVVDAASSYSLRVTPVSSTQIPGNRVLMPGSNRLDCRNDMGNEPVGNCIVNNLTDDIVLVAEPAPGQRLSSWLGCSSTQTDTSGGPPRCVVNRNLNGGYSAVRAEFAPSDTPVTVNVNLQGATARQVASLDDAINCPTVCSAQYAIGATVQLRASQFGTGDFLRWEGCDVTEGLTCTLNLAGLSRTVSAIYR
jgi:hypothetical protein